MKKLQGIGVSKGICIGKAFFYIVETLKIDDKEKDNIPVEKKEEILQKAIKAFEEEIQELCKKMKARGADKEVEIFQAHLLFLKDPSITKRIRYFLEKGFPLVPSIKKAFGEMTQKIEQMENTYFRERAKDIRDVSEKLIRRILNKPRPNLSSLPYPAIVVARDLTPSDTANLDKKNGLGFVTEIGGITSHTAILAQAFGIPAVVGAKGIIDLVKKDILILDGNDGEIIIEPDEEVLRHYKKKIVRIEKEKKELDKIKFLDAITKEGKRIEVFANIGKTEDADIALQEGAEGVGLFRTEFLFLNRTTPPTEEEQFEAYKMVLEKFKGKSVIIRTLDIGGDKQIPYLNLDKELNPFLGVRAIRLCLRRKVLFKTQLRAIIRASAYGKVKIMYPMIAIKEEIEQANKVLEEVKAEFIKENIVFDKNIEVGIMIEIPSAALSADELADYVDFFSIGTNDLMQYTFAADRTNQNLNYLYKPLHPAMLRLIKMTIDASHKKGKRTGLCGELAGDPEAIPILVKLGIDELSMSPHKIPQAKKIVREL